MKTESGRPGSNHPVDVEKVLQTAGSLFATFGFEGVGTREIARGSGCHVPSLYYHFDSKENLYREVFDDRWAALVKAVEWDVEHAPDPRSRLQALVDTFYDHFTQDRELLILLMRDLINASVAPPRYLSGAGHARLLDLTGRLLSDLLARPVDSHAAFTAMSLIFGYCCGSPLAGQGGRDSEFCKQHLAETILRMSDPG